MIDADPRERLRALSLAVAALADGQAASMQMLLSLHDDMPEDQKRQVRDYVQSLRDSARQIRDSS